MARSFTQVDVFSSTPLLGNPVAVVHDSEGLTTEQMQRFTDWTNLSEATFIGPPADPRADYSVRIFTQGAELPFAGHPTLGTAHAWLAAGGRPKSDVIVQECGIGLVSIRRDPWNDTLAFAAPPRRRSGPLDEDSVTRIAAGLGLRREDVIAHEWCDNGPPWQTLMLPWGEMVRSVVPDQELLKGLFIGLVGPQKGDASYEVRAFFPGINVLLEDPVTGSLNAAIGQWLIDSGRAPSSYVAAQGTMLGRAGRIYVNRIDEDTWIGGHCVSVLEGTANI